MTHTRLSTNMFFVARIELLFSQFKCRSELFMIIYRGRRVLQALFVCFLPDSIRYPQAHL